jgi:polar amino acid transport system substrate-binding protein
LTGYNLEENFRGNKMKRLVAILLSGIFILMACSGPVPADKLRILTEEYPPYNYTDEKGALTGSSTELVKAIIGKLGLDTKIEVLPWAQAYELVLNNPNVALYSTARIPERERSFMWAGPIGSYENWLYAKKGSAIRVNSLDEAKAVKSIAVTRNEAGQQKLAEQGFINFVFAGSTADGLKKLMAGEADLWLGTRADVEMVAKKAGVDATQLEPAVFVYKFDLYIAFNKNVPYATVEQWQKALDSLKK